MAEGQSNQAIGATDMVGRLRAMLESVWCRVYPSCNLSLDIKPTQSPKFGDFQCNSAMAFAKEVGQAPRVIAQAVVDALLGSEFSICFDALDVAGPGFINIHLSQ